MAGMPEYADVPKTLLRRVERIAAALPETTTKSDVWGHSFAIRRRIFCYLLAPVDPEGRASPMVILRADPMEREVLLAIGHPYFAPRFGEDRLGVVIGKETDWTEMRELLTESYRILAPKKLAGAL
jgi:hypothetical protein